MGRFRVAIIIPAFNESNSIYSVVKSVSKYGKAIVVDDGSSDNTSEIASNAGALVLKLPVNEGYDQALSLGFNEANRLHFNGCITFDADGQHLHEDIPKFIHLLKKGTDVIVGERNFKSRYSERLFSSYTNYFFKIKDPFSGMKGYSMKLYKSLGYFSKYNSLGTELLFYGVINDFLFDHIPIKIKQRKDKPRLGNIFSANLKIYWAMIQHIRVLLKKRQLCA